MRKITIFSLLLLLAVTITPVTGLATPKSGVASAEGQSLSGDVLIFTNGARFVIVVDAAKSGGQPDGIIDKYYWYGSTQSFPNGVAIRLANANVVDRGSTVELSSPSHGVRLVLSVDDTPSPDSSSESKKQEALAIRDSVVLERALARLTSPPVQEPRVGEF